MLTALDMAIQQRKPQDVIHHSDQESQYASIAFGERCEKMGVRRSMGAVGDAYGNAMAESIFATLECELIDRRSWQTKPDARVALFTSSKVGTTRGATTADSGRCRQRSVAGATPPMDNSAAVLTEPA